MVNMTRMMMMIMNSAIVMVWGLSQIGISLNETIKEEDIIAATDVELMETRSKQHRSDLNFFIFIDVNLKTLSF